MINVDKIRKDFPVYDREIKGKPIVYMDSACVSMKPRQVIGAINRYYNEFPACGGRSIHKLGKQVDEEVEKSRKEVKNFFNAKSEKEIIFTRNTTEAINLIAKSFKFDKNDVMLTSDKEHNSNLLPWQVNDKIEHRIFRFGDVEDFKEKVKGVRMVSMVHTSNLDGTSNPVEGMIKIAHENGALVMLDAAQSAPHKEVDVRDIDVDFLACSGHKMLGPSGIGVLYGKLGLLEGLNPFLVGGDTVKETTYSSHELEDVPERFEAGLQNYAGIIGLGEAVKYLKKVGLSEIHEHEVMLNKIITEGLKDVKGLKIIGPEEPDKRGGVFSFNIEGMNPHNIATMLSESSNIMIRSGAHCVHSWFNANKMDGSARASLYVYNTKEECEEFVEKVKEIAKFV
ncbi:MAG: cysteine desulfurase [Candidatus Woesearchaeota archaeon]|jgi:cysteine desulfurase/selenocysteine lyase|nr:cysteine desulfurase [Candidatus Woesearchaeota archaeon]MDP7610506.1 cysteine desulfurase [Candidatus Woesearchaeota archaeon]|tara:strand:+ start:5264 stop:6451 length:1188 start_codon:yes stop_codon:yes gene_type:complete